MSASSDSHDSKPKRSAQDALLTLSVYLDRADNAEVVSEVMAGYAAHDALVDGYAEWLQDLAPWRTFISLTLRPVKEIIWGREYKKEQVWSEEAARSAMGWLTHCLNREAFGASYKRVLKCHSYFSYAWFAESQRWGATHWHGVTTGPLHMAAVHRFWEHGHAWVRPIETADSERRICRYLSKYASKGGRLLSVYVARDHGKVPLPTPAWWVSDAEPNQLAGAIVQHPLAGL